MLLGEAESVDESRVTWPMTGGIKSALSKLNQANKTEPTINYSD